MKISVGSKIPLIPKSLSSLPGWKWRNNSSNSFWAPCPYENGAFIYAPYMCTCMKMAHIYIYAPYMCTCMKMAHIYMPHICVPVWKWRIHICAPYICTCMKMAPGQDQTLVATCAPPLPWSSKRYSIINNNFVTGEIFFLRENVLYFECGDVNNQPHQDDQPTEYKCHSWLVGDYLDENCDTGCFFFKIFLQGHFPTFSTVKGKFCSIRHHFNITNFIKTSELVGCKSLSFSVLKIVRSS